MVTLHLEIVLDARDSNKIVESPCYCEGRKNVFLEVTLMTRLHASVCLLGSQTMVWWTNIFQPAALVGMSTSEGLCVQPSLTNKRTSTRKQLYLKTQAEMLWLLSPAVSVLAPCHQKLVFLSSGMALEVLPSLWPVLSLHCPGSLSHHSL